MNVSDFIERYRNLVTVQFDFDGLAAAHDVVIKESRKPLADFLEFYVPRYSKGGSWDDRGIDQIVNDDASSIVQLKDVIASPADWGLPVFPDAESLRKRLWPIPLATDLNTDRTLILDGNHSICTLLIANMNGMVPCVEVTGDQLSALGTDLKLMLR